MNKFDLIVIGSGPAGEKAAVKAAYFGKKVALIEKEKALGGAGVNTGTLPSKTLRETALYLSGKQDKGLYGIDRTMAQEATIEHFLYRKKKVAKAEAETVKKNLQDHQVTLFHGSAEFIDAHTIKVGEKALTADHLILATGSYPVRPPLIPFDNRRIHDSDSILEITRFPKSIAILGAGVIGLEYATIFATMGAKVYLINRSSRILTFIDQQIVKELLLAMEEEGIVFLFNKNPVAYLPPTKEEDPLVITLDSGEKIEVDMFLFAAGRNGAVKNLHLERIGLEVDNRENIPVNSHYQTKLPHIYAVGDVIGFPALGSTGMDQGRVAVAHIYKTQDIEQVSQDLPYGIYTIPEISTIGLTEEAAAEKKIPIQVGVAHHAKMPRGKIMGATRGLLKLVFQKEDLVIVGVHIIGPLATELIHHGLSLIQGKRTLHDVIGMVYNFPTLHELYKYAAYDGLGAHRGLQIKK